MLYLRNHPPKLYNPLEDWNLLAGDPNCFYQVQVLYLIFKIINIIWTQPTYVIYLFSTPPNKVFCFCIVDIPTISSILHINPLICYYSHCFSASNGYLCISNLSLSPNPYHSPLPLITSPSPTSIVQTNIINHKRCKYSTTTAQINSSI